MKNTEKEELMKLMLGRFKDKEAEIQQLCLNEEWLNYLLYLQNEDIQEVKSKLGFRASSAVSEALKFQEFLK
ncbi:hypothetical protein [Listeria fleischmannii]|uniref:Uncharacterized protein n=1 Tax=Listeria fleischmannii FSL S10-1203 TaxID=1265822 RepID=W7D899_9LIST|nr:hypothetical protein [Listeria fleischmannii]EUJ48689.1 hypothetical protein MCOL2_17127 [Listeria fleischmannii FSL S10-1203]